MHVNTFILTNKKGEHYAYRRAGYGGRAYAFAIDWCIRSSLCLLIFCIGQSFYNTEGLMNFFQKFFPREGFVPSLEGMPSLLPWICVAVYFLYHPLLEIVMHGSTPGKKMARIAIVGPDCAPASIPALIVRNLLRPFDAFPGIYTVGSFWILCTDHCIRLGDLIARTQCIYTHRIYKTTVEGQTTRDLTEQEHKTLVDLLKRWETMTQDRKVSLANSFLKRIGRPTMLGVIDHTLEERLYRHLNAIALKNTLSSNDGK